MEEEIRSLAKTTNPPPPSGRLKNVTLLTNAVFLVWRAIEVDHNDAAKFSDADAIYIVVPLLFLVYYIVELVHRFSFGMVRAMDNPRCYVFYEFVFDTILAACLLLEIILRLASNRDQEMSAVWSLQVFRIFSFMSPTAVPELAILLKGLFTAARSVFCCIMLHTLITFAFAIVFTKCSSDALKAHFFEDVFESMHTLLVYGVVFNVTELANAMQQQNGWLEFLLVIYCVLNFVLLILMAGVIGEVVSVVSSVEKDNLVCQYLNDVLDSFRATPERGWSKAEWETRMKDKDFQRLLESFGADVDCLCDRSNELFVTRGEVPTAEFTEVILRSRTSEKATVKDILYQTKVLQKMVGTSGTPDQVSTLSPRPDETAISQAVTACLQPIVLKLQEQEQILNVIMESSRPMPGQAMVQNGDLFQVEQA